MGVCGCRCLTVVIVASQLAFDPAEHFLCLGEELECSHIYIYIYILCIMAISPGEKIGSGQSKNKS